MIAIHGLGKINSRKVPIRIVLNKDNFTTLVSGGYVDIQGVEIALQDIGYIQIIKIIGDLLNDNL